MKPVDNPPAPEETARMKATALAVSAALSLPEASRPAASEAGALRRLTEAVRRGDEAAFAELYDRHSLRLYKFLLALTRGDEPAAREIFQNVALKLARKMEVFDDEARLRAWLATLARHAFLDHCRARARRERQTAPLPEMFAAKEAARPGWAEALPGVLAGLAPDDRELLEAAYLDGRPLGELAAERGETYKAVESRLARLRLKTKAALLKFLRHENAS
jgi:RNA polymerase sigma-70 factor (ECF subfamily)